VEQPESSCQRGFWSLIVTQFQGAFSDNALKQLALFMGISLGMKEHAQDQLTSLTMALLTLPFIFFSMFGGSLATRYSKRDVTIAVKVFEILIMLVAAIGLAHRNLVLVLGCVFSMGVHSAVFGPSKYGSLPELLPEKRLSWGNGILELGTFLAIILGTVGGSMLSVIFEGTPAWAGMTLLGLAALGLATSFGITRIPGADPSHPIRINFLSDLRDQCRIIRRDRVLKMAVIGNTFFWFLAGLLFLNLFTYGRFTLACDKQHIGYLQAALAIGIGVGSVAAGYLSGGKIEYGLVPMGLIGITTFSALLARSAIGYQAVLWHISALGFFAGFYAVPINAIMQHRPRKEEKAGVLAAANLISSAGTFLSSGVYYLLRVWPHDTRMIFLIGAVMTLLAFVYTLVLMPDSLLRLLLWMFTHSIYRIRVEGRDNIPEKGGALFVCNHVSFVDALLLLASTDRPLRPIMFKDIYDHPVVKPFAKIMRAIPISSQLRPREMIKSLREASDAIKNGEVVVIFAEGQITRIGQLLPFRRGFERVMKGVDAPIIPVCLDGVWGSIFSFEKGRFLWKVPRYFPYPVTVSFGKPMPPTSTPFEVRQAVQELNTEAWKHRKKLMSPIHRTFVRKARHHPLRFFMADARTPNLKFGAALTRTIFLARRLRSVWARQEMVGILMPPSVAGALVNYAALLMGKVPVNLNYTANDEVLASCARQCNLQTVVTSKAFLEKVKVTAPGKIILVEDLAAKPRTSEKLAAFFMAKFLPVGLLERALCSGFGSAPASSAADDALVAGNEGSRSSATVAKQELGPPDRLDQLATVIFSSGSTGDPKGVMLTHYNIVSNAEQLGQTFAFGGRDRILGILPFFHSFGFTGTLVIPAVLGVGVVYNVSPLDARTIGALVRDYRVTFLLATPTFLQMYNRGCEPEDFGSLQFVMTGAEKLPDRVAQAFEDKFGIRPLEAYGLTECSPAVTVNTRDFRAAGFRQVGAKRGKIGHPLPAVSVRVVDPDTFQPVPVGQPGLLLVRGPNVMKGYLGKPEKTAEVIRDGWYVTGDIAALDEDGFLTITDRLTRFSKIGGEMVPHIKVEEKLHELAGATEQCFAVTGVPDEKKGERLVVLHTLTDDNLRLVLDKLAACDLPNLWKPRPDQFFQIAGLPYLGTGKLDLRKVKETAQQVSAG
jgi:acyl-[acyl-carrier-protein]-phospholipid O-acyltransferase/long-chain-fatty-acid--[acyl-carrier-protein] ligase